MSRLSSDKFERFLEFAIVGILLGVTEDLIAVKVATGAQIGLETIAIVVAVALPFAAISELVVDRDEIKLSELLGLK